eukprot:COSAG04_NODE_1_length_58448_cov_23.476478_39_plen_112_part_00
MDRRSIALSGMQLDLVQAIASQTTTPIIVVLIHGGAQQRCFCVWSFLLHFVRVLGPIDVSALMGMARVEAVLTAGYPGQRGGEAIANGARDSHGASTVEKLTACRAQCCGE